MEQACCFRWLLSVCTILGSLLLFLTPGCDAKPGVLSGVLLSTSFHEKLGLKAERYFDDPQVLKLCEAIEANDLKTMQQLIDQGVNVDVRGKDGVTPLLWAFRTIRSSDSGCSCKTGQIQMYHLLQTLDCRPCLSKVTP